MNQPPFQQMPNPFLAQQMLQPVMQQQQQQQQQNGIANSGNLAQIPDDQLAKMANNPGNTLMQLAALSEVQKRKQARDRAVAERADKGMGMTVKDQILRGAGYRPEMAQPPNPVDVVNPAMIQRQQGLPGLPTGQAVPQQYAEGGIVRFQNAGFVADGINEQQGYDQLTPKERLARDRAMAAKAIIPPWLHGAYEAAMGQEGAGNPYARYPTAPSAVAARTASTAAPAPTGHGDATWSPPVGNFGSSAPIPKPIPDKARSGIGGLPPGVSPVKLPTYTNPTIGLPPMHMSDEDYDARFNVENARIQRLLGEDVSKQYSDEIKAERAGMGEKYERIKGEGILDAGLRIMGGKSPHWAVNVGEGGIASLENYRGQREKLDNEAKQLRREGMQADLAGQQRKDQAAFAALGRTDKRDADMATIRGEVLQSNIAMNDFGLKLAQLGIEGQKVQAMMADVGAKYAAIEARYGEVRNDRILKIFSEERDKANNWVLGLIKADTTGRMAKDAEANPDKYADMASEIYEKNLDDAMKRAAPFLHDKGAGASVNVGGFFRTK